MKMIVCGGRDYEPTCYDGDMLVALLRYFKPGDVLTGGARGVDLWAEDIAREMGIGVVTYLPDYDKHGGSRAPLVRNEDMAKDAVPDGPVVAFTGNTGTAHMVGMGRKHRLAIVDLRRLSRAQEFSWIDISDKAAR